MRDFANHVVGGHPWLGAADCTWPDGSRLVVPEQKLKVKKMGWGFNVVQKLVTFQVFWKRNRWRPEEYVKYRMAVHLNGPVRRSFDASDRVEAGR